MTTNYKIANTVFFNREFVSSGHIITRNYLHISTYVRTAN